MREVSAGLLAYRRRSKLEVLLGHPGGPFWARKDAAAWTIPKGIVEPGDDLLSAARREFQEETGFAAEGNFALLAPVKQKSGKIVHAFAVELDCDPSTLVSNTFEIEWPPRSGHRKTFPELDRAAWFDLVTARAKIISYQLPFLDEIERTLR